MYISPIHIDSLEIYDILYNDNNELIVITPYIPTPHVIKYISGDDMIQFDTFQCPHNHTIIFSLKVEYTQNIKIMVNDILIETPSFV